MASPRRLEIPQESLDEPSMIPYSQSSQKNGDNSMNDIEDDKLQ